MVKKTMLLAMAIGALVALAVPAVAGAAQLTNENEELVEGTVSAVSTNTVTNLASGDVLTCEQVEIHGIVLQNDGNTVELGMDGEADSASGCLLNEKVEVAINPTLESLSASGTGPGTAAFSFEVVGRCTESATASTVEWNGTSTIDIVAPVNGGCGPGTLTGEFTLSNAEGEVIAED